MNGQEVLQIARESIWLLLQIATPLLLISLVIGLVVSLFQALTQIQEMTLTFVPKIVLLMLGFIFLLPHMSQNLENFTNLLFDRIVAIK